MRNGYFLTAVLALGLSAASCFQPPKADVLFRCDPQAAPACPEGYTCEADGCCHKDGSDLTAHRGECRADGATTDGGMSAGTTTSAATSGTDASAGTSSGAGSSSGDSTTGTDATAGSSGTGTTGLAL